MKPNPPIKGHTLRFEGRPLLSGTYGACLCGASPEGWPNVSAYAVKRWHREHKAELCRIADEAKRATEHEAELRAAGWTPAEWEAWHNPPCPPQEEIEIDSVTQCPGRPEDAPEVGSIWMGERSGRVIEVRAVTETNGVWQIETESHPIRSIRMAYTVADFLATFTPLPTGDS